MWIVQVLSWGVLDGTVRCSQLSGCLVSGERRVPLEVCYFGRFCHSWPSRVPCLPAIVHDYVTYLVWQHLSLQWLRVCCQSGGRPPKSHNTLGQRKTCVLPDAHLRLLHDLAFGSYGSALYLSLLLKMRILEVAPLVVVLPMVVPPSSAKPVLVLNLIQA